MFIVFGQKLSQTADELVPCCHRSIRQPRKPRRRRRPRARPRQGDGEIRKRGPLGASGSTTWFTRESQRAHGDISFHSTKSTQGLTGSKRKKLSAFSNIPVGHCSCEVPKRKGGKEMDEKDGAEAWAYLIRLIRRSPRNMFTSP